MIFSLKSYKAGPEYRKEKSVWETRFAFLPTCVSMDNNTGRKNYVWFEWYEVRLYYEDDQGWWREYRLPNSDITWKVDASVRD